MDTSKEYIEMMRKAPELREKWAWEDGDFFTSGKGNDEVFVYFNCPEDDNLWYVNNSIPLLRQDQLQDMLDFCGTILIGHIPDTLLMMQTTYLGKKNTYKAKSHEQLLLMCLMHEKYGKRWDGSDWVSE